MIENITLALSSGGQIQSAAGRLPKCARCNSDASPLFLGFETVQMPSEEYPSGLVRPALWCRGCISLFQTNERQEHEVAK